MEKVMNKNQVSVNGQENEAPTNITIKGIIRLLTENVDSDNGKRLIPLGLGDPTAFACFSAPAVAQQAVVDALFSNKFNGYSPTVGLPQTRKAIAEYLSRDLPYELAQDDVYITAGCTQSIEFALSVLSGTNNNILLPRPGFPTYGLCANLRNLEARYYDLLPDKNWEVDLDAVEALVDHNTVAIVIINPGNPCGNVYSYQHLNKIAEVAKKLNIVIIADEVYGHLTFGANPFVPMGVFGSIAPVFTIGSLSKRWLVPGWRLGWFVINDPTSIFKTPKFIERVKKYCDISGDPATFIQAAVPCIIEQTKEAFYSKTLNMLKQTSDLCYEKIKQIPCISCPYKPQGAMCMMVKLNLEMLEDISDDIDFCFRLAREESVVLLPGVAVGRKHWLRIAFATDPTELREGLERLKSFCKRHTKKY